MEKESKSSKFIVEIKQNRKGRYYLGSLKINADKKEEFENLLDSSLAFVNKKLDELNSSVKQIQKYDIDPEEELDLDDLMLFEKLRQIRLDLSRDEMVPAYGQGIAVAHGHNKVKFRPAHFNPCCKGQGPSMDCMKGVKIHISCYPCRAAYPGHHYDFILTHAESF